MVTLDHLVYATTDLDGTCAEIERLWGIRPSTGGQHLGRGTRNALLAFGPASYFEIIGPDPHQPAPPAPRWFAVDAASRPTLVAWAVRAADVSSIAAAAARRGVPLGAVRNGSRKRADGVALSWTFTDPTVVVADGLVPFFIDWGDSPHPAASAAGGVELVAFTGEHPDPVRVREMLDAVGVELQVERGPVAALSATIRTPLGLVQLR
jgi:hypothetical protein